MPEGPRPVGAIPSDLSALWSHAKRRQRECQENGAAAQTLCLISSAAPFSQVTPRLLVASYVLRKSRCLFRLCQSSDIFCIAPSGAARQNLSSPPPRRRKAKQALYRATPARAACATSPHLVLHLGEVCVLPGLDHPHKVRLILGRGVRLRGSGGSQREVQSRGPQTGVMDRLSGVSGGGVAAPRLGLG